MNIICTSQYRFLADFSRKSTILLYLLLFIITNMEFFSLMFTPFSHPAILVGGTAVFFILGWLWYNPITPIGKIWISYFPMPTTMPAMHQFAVMVVIQLLMGFIVTHTVMAFWLFATVNGLSAGLATLFIVKMYMGFVFIKDIGHWYFEQKPFPLVLISVGYYLVGILGVCALLSYFL